jgi:DNA-binding LytR/AlgR family response regulator
MPELIKILIVEDEYPAAERLQKLVAKTDPNSEIVGLIDSVEAANNWLDLSGYPDLILSDIQLSDGLSFQIYENRKMECPIVFTTSYDEYAIKAFKVQGIDYLLKPIKETELGASLQKFRQVYSRFSALDYSSNLDKLIEQFLPKTYKNRFLIKSADQLIPIHEDQIAYFYTTNQWVCLVRNDGQTHMVDYTLEELEQMLNPKQFFRLNRQFMARLTAIHKIYQHFNGKLKIDLSPVNKEEVLVSKEKAPVFRRWLEGEN